jgi:hypothetical protein
MGSPPCVSGWLFRTRNESPFHTRNGSPFLEIDPDREIVAIDVESDVNVLWVQAWTGGIAETPDFATRISRGRASGSPGLPSSRFLRWISQVVFIGSLQPTMPHRVEGD